MGQTPSQETNSCFACSTHQESKIEWKKQLKLECQQLNCEWSKKILKQMKKLKKSPNHVFYQQVQSANMEFRCNLQRSQRANSYVNTLGQSNIDDSIPISKLLKTTELVDIGQDYTEEMLRYFLKITKVLEIQLKNTDHQLNFVMNIFVASFISQQDNQNIEKMFYDLQEFARIFTQALKNYYDHKYLLSQVGSVGRLFNRQNITTWIINILFQYEQVSRIVYDSIANYIRTDVELYRKQIEKVEIELPDESKQINFEKIIKKVSLLHEIWTPLGKLKLLIEIQRKVSKLSQQLQISDDIGYLQYILVQSKMFDLPIHIYLVERIRPQSTHYLTNIKVAMKMILQQNQWNK
ncbi:hypothetical protein pb186bvf_015643 [Paramecium bursaria]